MAQESGLDIGDQRVILTELRAMIAEMERRGNAGTSAATTRLPIPGPVPKSTVDSDAARLLAQHKPSAAPIIKLSHHHPVSMAEASSTAQEKAVEDAIVEEVRREADKPSDQVVHKDNHPAK
jgi:hypothetical protein